MKILLAPTPTPDVCILLGASLSQRISMDSPGIASEFVFGLKHKPAGIYPTYWIAPRQRAALIPSFATLVQARRHTPPKQVRYPTDRQFASGYSPPRLTTTQ